MGCGQFQPQLMCDRVHKINLALAQSWYRQMLKEQVRFELQPGGPANIEEAMLRQMHLLRETRCREATMSCEPVKPIFWSIGGDSRLCHC